MNPSQLKTCEEQKSHETDLLTCGSEMLADLANEGAVQAGEQESLVPFNLTLQWLESNPNRWPETEESLLALIRGFCEVEVDVGATAVVDILEDYGLISGVSHQADAAKQMTDKLRVKYDWERFQDGVERMRTKQVAFAMTTVADRVVQLLLAFRKDPKELPQTRGQLEAMVASNSQVVFKTNPRTVLANLENNEYLEIDANTDVVKYDGPRVVTWQDPPRNKGFGIGSFLLVIVIILMMTPGALQALGVF